MNYSNNINNNFNNVIWYTSNVLKNNMKSVIFNILLMITYNNVTAQVSFPNNYEYIKENNVSDLQYWFKLLSLKDTDWMQYSESHNIYFKWLNQDKKILFYIDSMCFEFHKLSRNNDFKLTTEQARIILEKKLLFYNWIEYGIDTIYIKDPYLNYILNIPDEIVIYKIRLNENNQLIISVWDKSLLDLNQKKQALLWWFWENNSYNNLKITD